MAKEQDNTTNDSTTEVRKQEIQDNWMMAKLQQEATATGTPECEIYGHIGETNFYDLGKLAGDMVTKLFGSQVVS